MSLQANSEFRENAAGLTGQVASQVLSLGAAFAATQPVETAMSLTSGFGAAAAAPDFEDHAKEQAVELKHYIFEQMNLGRDIAAGAAVGGASSILANAMGELLKGHAQLQDKRERSARDALMLDMLDQIRDLEDRLGDLYGENFAEDMLADIHESGHISEDEYSRIMAIEDEDLRRQAIAELINEKLENGELTLDDLKDYEWAEEWLNLYEQKEKAEIKAAMDVTSGKTNLDKAADNVVEKVGGLDGADQQLVANAIDVSHKNEQSQEQTVLESGVAISGGFSFGGFAKS